MPPDAILTPYERRCWKQLQRQLEAGDLGRARSRSSRRTVAVLVAVGVVLSLLAAAAIGGAVAVAAVVAYLCVSLTLWTLARLVLGT